MAADGAVALDDIRPSSAAKGLLHRVGDGSAVVLQKRFSHESMAANFKRGAALV
jgi:hypothetical protein